MRELAGCMAARIALDLPSAPIDAYVQALTSGLLIWDENLASYFRFELVCLTNILWLEPLRWHRYVALVREFAFPMVEAPPSVVVPNVSQYPSVDPMFDSDVFERYLSSTEPNDVKPQNPGKRFGCCFPGCKKQYASTDGVRKHARLEHTAWAKEHRGDVKAVCRPLKVAEVADEDDAMTEKAVADAVAVTVLVENRRS